MRKANKPEAARLEREAGGSKTFTHTLSHQLVMQPLSQPLSETLTLSKKLISRLFAFPSHPNITCVYFMTQRDTQESLYRRLESTMPY